LTQGLGLSYCADVPLNNLPMKNLTEAQATAILFAIEQIELNISRLSGCIQVDQMYAGYTKQNGKPSIEAVRAAEKVKIATAQRTTLQHKLDALKVAFEIA
jgi:hypothetical protein